MYNILKVCRMLLVLVSIVGSVSNYWTARFIQIFKVVYCKFTSKLKIIYLFLNIHRIWITIKLCSILQFRHATLCRFQMAITYREFGSITYHRYSHFIFYFIIYWQFSFALDIQENNLSYIQIHQNVISYSWHNCI